MTRDSCIAVSTGPDAGPFPRRAGELSSGECAFLDASNELARTEIAERDAQRQRELEAARQLADTQRRAATQLRQRAMFLAAALVLVLGMAIVALFFGEQAQRNAVTAQTLAHIASSRELAATRDRQPQC